MAPARIATATFGVATSVCLLSGMARAQDGGAVVLPEVVVAASPVPNTPGIAANKVPAFVTTVPAVDFEERRSPTVADTLTSHVPGAIAINVDGSDISPDLFYRGFDASRLSGVANGLAVYQNGVRINEAFGDGVNLDLIPPIAIDHTDVYTNNPIFGLNALGGAIAFTMKNGFTFHGGDATILGGSYGRVNGFAEYGKQVGNYSFYGAVDALRDGGYRPFGASNLQRAYADLGYRSQDAEVHAIGSFGRSLLGVQGVTPLVLVNQQYNSVFTTPQTTNNQAGIAQLTSRVEVAPHWTVSSNFFIRQFDQFHVDGNDADVEGCRPGGGGTPTVACLDDDSAPNATSAQRAFQGNIPYLGAGFPYGTTARTATHTTSFGTSQQATDTQKIFGHDNYFVVGGDIYTANTNFSSSTTLGMLNSQFVNQESGFPGAGTVLNTNGNLGYSPTYVTSNATYYGIFALDTFNVTKALAVTAGARLNLARIKLADLTGTQPDLNTYNEYNRINPVVGATYEFAPAFTVYGGYSESNRAPTPLENACSNPERPCVLETALVSDPPLQQIVGRTVEAGARGVYALPSAYGSLTYKAGYFRTSLTNDIVQEQSAISGQGYFTNVAGSRREGVEAGVIYNRGPFSFYGNYALVNATYQFTGQLSSPNNPDPTIQANGGLENVTPGKRIPGIPTNIGKLGFEWHITPRFAIGVDTTLVGSQYYIGDDTNVNGKVPFYYRVDARATYLLTDHVQLFVLSTNLTNNHYATYGTFYGTDTTGGNVNATLFNNNPDNGGLGDARAVTVAQPLSFYGGVKVLF